MPLYFITGVAGSGKSTIIKELERNGYEAYDVDEAGPVTAKWHNNKTGHPHPKSSIKAEDRTPEFLSEHDWKVPRQEVEELARRAESKTVFMGGAIANEDEVRDLFRSVFALIVDAQTHKNRLMGRTSNDWGKNPHELELSSIEHNNIANRTFKEPAYLPIDATQSIEAVVKAILDSVNEG